MRELPMLQIKDLMPVTSTSTSFRKDSSFAHIFTNKIIVFLMYPSTDSWAMDAQQAQTCSYLNGTLYGDPCIEVITDHTLVIDMLLRRRLQIKSLVRGSIRLWDRHCHFSAHPTDIAWLCSSTIFVTTHPSSSVRCILSMASHPVLTVALLGLWSTPCTR